MKTWEDYKAHVKAQGQEDKENMEWVEEITSIIGKAMIQHDPADKNGSPSDHPPQAKPL